VLCATDIAARGIHVDDVALVVHVDPPAEHKAYLHRSGRTARAGAGGLVVTISTPEQAGEVRTLARQAGISPRVATVRPGAAEITALTGPAAPYVEPTPVPAPQTRPKGGGRRRSDTTSAARPERTTGPARTRAELAARTGTHSAAAVSARYRRGR
jgi:superfamily II DNA/RNA helicase